MDVKQQERSSRSRIMRKQATKVACFLYAFSVLHSYIIQILKGESNMTNEYKMLRGAISDEKEKIDALRDEITIKIHRGELNGLGEMFQELTERENGFPELTEHINRELEGHKKICLAELLNTAVDYNDKNKFELARICLMMPNHFAERALDDNYYGMYDSNGLPNMSSIVSFVARNMQIDNLSSKEFVASILEPMLIGGALNENHVHMMENLLADDIAYLMSGEVFEHLSDDGKKEFELYCVESIAEDAFYNVENYDLRRMERSPWVEKMSFALDIDPTLSLIKNSSEISVWNALLSAKNTIVFDEEFNYGLIENGNYNEHENLAHYPNLCKIFKAMDALEERFASEQTISPIARDVKVLEDDISW